MTIEKVDLELKIAERVHNLGIFGTDADNLVKHATESAWSHIELGGDAGAVVNCTETFIREGITKFDLGKFVESHDATGHQYRFERKRGAWL